MLFYQRLCVFFVFFLGRVQLQPMADWQITSAGQVITGGPLGRKLLEIGLIPDLERWCPIYIWLLFFFRFYGISKNHCIQSIHIVTMGYLTVSKIRFLLLKGYFSWHNKWFHHISESEVWGNKIGSPKPGGSQWLVMVSLVMVRIPLYVIPIKSINLSHKSI